MPYGIVKYRKDAKENSIVRPVGGSRPVVLSKSSNRGFPPRTKVFYNPPTNPGKKVDFADFFIPIPEKTNGTIEDGLRDITKSRMADTDIESPLPLLIFDSFQDGRHTEVLHYITIAKDKKEVVEAALHFGPRPPEWYGEYGNPHYEGSNGLFGKRGFKLGGVMGLCSNGIEQHFLDRDHIKKSIRVIGIEGMVYEGNKSGYWEALIPDEVFKLCVEHAGIRK